MTTLPNWIDGSWDRVVLGGVTLPGVVRTFSVATGRNLTLTKGKGEDGPTLTDEGYTGATFDLVLAISTPREIAEASGALGVLAPKRPGQPAEPKTIAHPVPAALGIATVYVQSLSFGMPDAAGLWLLTAKLVEWLPGPKKTQSSNVPQGGGGGGTGNGGAFGDPAVPAPDPANLGGDFP
jgi:hypothetical protein